MSADIIWSKQQFNEVFELGSFMSRGSFSLVHKCKHLVTSEERCVRVYKKVTMSEEQLDQLYNEINFYQIIDLA
jgi:hypothetical protein